MDISWKFTLVLVTFGLCAVRVKPQIAEVVYGPETKERSVPNFETRPRSFVDDTTIVYGPGRLLAWNMYLSPHISYPAELYIRMQLWQKIPNGQALFKLLYETRYLLPNNVIGNFTIVPAEQYYFETDVRIGWTIEAIEEREFSLLPIPFDFNELNHLYFLDLNVSSLHYPRINSSQQFETLHYPAKYSISVTVNQDIVADCSLSPCQNNGVCVDVTDGYICYCQFGWSGIHCDVEISPCQTNPSPCYNGGTCHDSVNQMFSCSCPSGYTGILCEQDIDECLSSPCLNGGVCEDMINQYKCYCMHNWIGAHCEQEYIAPESLECIVWDNVKEHLHATQLDYPVQITCQTNRACTGLDFTAVTEDQAGNEVRTCFGIAFDSCAPITGIQAAYYTAVDGDHIIYTNRYIKETFDVPVGLIQSGEGFTSVSARVYSDMLASGHINITMNYNFITSSGGDPSAFISNLIGPTLVPLPECSDVTAVPFDGNTGLTCGTSSQTDTDNSNVMGTSSTVMTTSSTEAPINVTRMTTPYYTAISGEFCAGEVFRPNCDNGHVILVTSASYGRMNIGRCITEDYGNIGCRADVTFLLQSRCSGQQSCILFIPHEDLDVFDACPVDSASYLAVQYSCFPDPRLDQNTPSPLYEASTTMSTSLPTVPYSPTVSEQYCFREIFQPNCGNGHVLFIASASYGRMNIGRCITENYGYIGCQADVTFLLQSRCSGQQSCILFVPHEDLDVFNECPEDLQSYLEVNYACLPDPRLDEDVVINPDPRLDEDVVINPDFGACLSNPCFHGGTCISINDGQDYECLCHPEFTRIRTGKGNCDSLFAAPCLSDPCLHGGTCMEIAVDDYFCVCKPGFIDYNCQTVDIPTNAGANLCYSNPCRNGGTCSITDYDGFPDVQCSCLPQFTSFWCEKYLILDSDTIYDFSDPCLSKPCQFGGTCIADENSGYRCLCLDQFTGYDCQIINNDLCAQQPPACRHNGTCISYDSTEWSCSCRQHFTGTNCEIIDNTICLSDPCQHGGTCFDTEDKNYRCECLPPFSGSRCEMIGMPVQGQPDTTTTYPCPQVTCSPCDYGYRQDYNAVGSDGCPRCSCTPDQWLFGHTDHTTVPPCPQVTCSPCGTGYKQDYNAVGSDGCPRCSCTLDQWPFGQTNRPTAPPCPQVTCSPCGTGYRQDYKAVGSDGCPKCSCIPDLVSQTAPPCPQVTCPPCGTGYKQDYKAVGSDGCPRCSCIPDPFGLCPMITCFPCEYGFRQDHTARSSNGCRKCSCVLISSSSSIPPYLTSSEPALTAKPSTKPPHQIGPTTKKRPVNYRITTRALPWWFTTLPPRSLCPGEFWCIWSSFESNTHCIPKSWVCDGKYDCPKHEDEMDCIVRETDKGMNDIEAAHVKKEEKEENNTLQIALITLAVIVIIVIIVGVIIGFSLYKKHSTNAANAQRRQVYGPTGSEVTGVLPGDGQPASQHLFYEPGEKPAISAADPEVGKVNEAFVQKDGENTPPPDYKSVVLKPDPLYEVTKA